MTWECLRTIHGDAEWTSNDLTFRLTVINLKKRNEPRNIALLLGNQSNSEHHFVRGAPGTLFMPTTESVTGQISPVQNLQKQSFLTFSTSFWQLRTHKAFNKGSSRPKLFGEEARIIRMNISAPFISSSQTIFVTF
jgi:hypothetical protein